MKLPTIKQCFEWYEEQHTPENIIRHVKKVRKVAVFLAKELKHKGIKLDIGAIDRGALLHDLDKWMTLANPKLEHGVETERILTQKGYPYLGFLARQHRSDLLLEEYRTWEEKIVSYADKRVLQDSIVDMKARYEYAVKRYNDVPHEQRQREMQFMEKVEKEIFSIIGIQPDELVNKLS